MDSYPPEHDPLDPAAPPEDLHSHNPESPTGWHSSADPQGFPAGQPLTTLAPDNSAPAQVVVVSEGVSYVPAGLWWRIGAFAIDLVILAIAHQIMLFIVGYTPPDLDQMLVMLEQMMAEFMATGEFSDATMAQVATYQQVAFFKGWLNVFTCAAYFTAFHGLLGATLGKLSLGLVVLRHDGSRLGYGIAFIRYMGYLIVAKLAYTAWMIPFNREKRTLYDMLLGTNVYRVKP